MYFLFVARHHIISRGHLPPQEPFFTADIEPAVLNLHGKIFFLTGNFNFSQIMRKGLKTFALIVYATAHAVHVATPCYVTHERARKGRNLFT